MDFFEKSTILNGRFVSYPDEERKGFFDLLKWKATHESKPWPRSRALPALPKQAPLPSSPHITATWITHSTVLLNVDGITVLTDPVFSERVGPLPWLGIKRSTPPSHSIQSLPRIDLILISHNHYDHLDAPSLRTLISLYDPLIITPLGHASLLSTLGSSRVVELDWWQSYFLSQSLTVHLTPALHWSKRSLWDTCKSLWGSFVLEGKNHKVYFAGDTGYASHFQMIYKRFGPMDLSLLPIGAYEPRWFMKNFHMNPADAVQAHLDLDSKFSMGIHFGTFKLTDEGIDDPVYDLEAALLEAPTDRSTFIAPLQGQRKIV